MKKLTRRSFTAAGILAALGMTGAGLKACDPLGQEIDEPEGFDPSANEVEEVYGPPEDFDPSANEIEGVYGPPDGFDPSQNEPEAIYGPPEAFGLDEDGYDPSANELVDVYGPPAD